MIISRTAIAGLFEQLSKTSMYIFAFFICTIVAFLIALLSAQYGVYLKAVIYDWKITKVESHIVDPDSVLVQYNWNQTIKRDILHPPKLWMGSLYELKNVWIAIEPNGSPHFLGNKPSVKGLAVWTVVILVSVAFWASFIFAIAVAIRFLSKNLALVIKR